MGGFGGGGLSVWETWWGAKAKETYLDAKEACLDAEETCLSVGETLWGANSADLLGEALVSVS
jgi:hypothetical protein